MVGSFLRYLRKEEGDMWKSALCYFMVLCFLCTTTSCATIVSGRSQQVSVVTTPTDAIVTVGGMKQMAPASFILDRRMGVYQVMVEKEGYEPVVVTLKKGVNGWVFGNIIFGGIIGLVIDIASGSASKFTPSEVEVNLIKQKLTSLNNVDFKDKDILFVKLVEK